ncbi:MAG: hypothetical protein AAF763_12585 [Pseudomonadota bacterium]
MGAASVEIAAETAAHGVGTGRTAVARAFTTIRAWALAAVAAGPADAAAEDAPIARLSTGHEIVMQPARSLDCRALAAKLAEIDATGYRGARPEPRNPADMPLLLYENRVSNQYYSRCMRMQERAPDGDHLFRGGFRAGGPRPATASSPASSTDRRDEP